MYGMLHTKDRDAVHSLRYFWSTRTRHQTSYFGWLWRGHCLQLAQKAQHVAKGETLAQHSPKAAQPAAAAATATAAAEASPPTPTPTPTPTPPPPPLHPAPLSQAAGPPEDRGAASVAAPGVPQSSLVQHPLPSSSGYKSYLAITSRILSSWSTV